jgi:ribosomal protein L40E
MGEMSREELAAMTDPELLAYEREHDGAPTWPSRRRKRVVAWTDRDGVVCGSCGAQSRPTAKFCSECGTQLLPGDNRPDRPAHPDCAP